MRLRLDAQSGITRSIPAGGRRGFPNRPVDPAVEHTPGTDHPEGSPPERHSRRAPPPYSDALYAHLFNHPVRSAASPPPGGGHLVTFRVGAAALDEAVVTKLIEVQNLRDRTLAGHARRTSEVAVAIGGALRCDLEVLDMLYLAGQLHDIGKLGVTESTLWKPAGLSHAEWREIRSHPEEGHRLIANVVHRDVAAAVLYHHERPDRGGYPFGIDARTLPLVARVVSVADAFDAMTAGRPYQKAVTVRAAVDEIERCVGTQFDADVADALRSVCLTRGDPRLNLGGPTGDQASAESEPPVPDLSDAPEYGPANPSPADPFEQSPSMVRLRGTGSGAGRTISQRGGLSRKKPRTTRQSPSVFDRTTTVWPVSGYMLSEEHTPGAPPPCPITRTRLCTRSKNPRA